VFKIDKKFSYVKIDIINSLIIKEMTYLFISSVKKSIILIKLKTLKN